eukprot:5946102-Alexandrium_andersonii.AAC.1
MAIRNECLRDPTQRARALGIAAAYCERGYVGVVEGGSQWEPAPPPGAPKRALWAPAARPAGP